MSIYSSLFMAHKWPVVGFCNGNFKGLQSSVVHRSGHSVSVPHTLHRSQCVCVCVCVDLLIVHTVCGMCV